MGCKTNFFKPEAVIVDSIVGIDAWFVVDVVVEDRFVTPSEKVVDEVGGFDVGGNFKVPFPGYAGK